MVCIRGKADSALAKLGPTVVAAVHLDATSEEKRVAQVEKTLELTRRFGTRELIVAGDMNTELAPGSCVEAFLGSSSSADESSAESRAARAREAAIALRVEEASLSEEQLQEWAALRQSAREAGAKHRVSLSGVPTGATRAAWEHDGSKRMGTWRLDHILYSHRTLECVRSWASLEADPFSVAVGLPNEHSPSDHLPVAACFKVTETPTLGEAERQAFVGRWNSLGSKHGEEAGALEAECQQ